MAQNPHLYRINSGFSPFFYSILPSLATPCNSLRTLSRAGWSDFVFAFHDGEEIGPRMLVRISKHTGLKPSDL